MITECYNKLFLTAYFSAEHCSYHIKKFKAYNSLKDIINPYFIAFRIHIHNSKQSTIFISVVIAIGLCLVNCHDNIKKLYSYREEPKLVQCSIRATESKTAIRITKPTTCLTLLPFFVTVKLVKTVKTVKYE